MIRQLIKEALQEKLMSALKKFFIGRVVEDGDDQKAKILEVEEQDYYDETFILIGLQYSCPDCNHRVLHGEIKKQVMDYFTDSYVVMFYHQTKRPLLDDF